MQPHSKTSQSRRIAIFHPAFGAVGGAELLALSHASLLAEDGFELGVRTFRLDTAIWDSKLRAFDTKSLDEGLRLRHKIRLAIDETRVRRAWAERELRAWDIVVAHNFPANAMLGRANIDAVKVWYCHEPNRNLHPIEANPYLWNCLKNLRNAKDCRAIAYYYRRLYAPWRRSSILGTSLWRRHRNDIEASSHIHQIWANSEYTRDNVLRVLGPRHVDVVYPIVEFIDAPPARFGIRRQAFRVMTLSRQEELKNVETILKGFALFRNRCCPDAMLDIIGEGRDRRYLERLRDSLDLKRNVLFHGFVSQNSLNALASSCDVFAALPFDEPFGMVFPEAASHGLLLIGPDHGGPQEILDDGRIGQLVGPVQPDGLADALERIFRMSDAEANQARQKADQSCRGRFARNVIGPRLLEAVRNL